MEQRRPKRRVPGSAASICAALLVSALGCAVLLIASSPVLVTVASAQSPTELQYDDPAEEFTPTGSTHSEPGEPSAKTDGGGLPFTGWDLGAIAGVAASLLAAGFILRRLTAPRWE